MSLSSGPSQRLFLLLKHKEKLLNVFTALGSVQEINVLQTS